MTLFSDPVFKAVVSAEISMLMAEPELAGHLSELNIPGGGGDVQKAELINGCLRYNRDYIKSLTSAELKSPWRQLLVSE